MSGNRTEIFFFSSLPSLFSVTPHPSVSFSLASSVLTPRNAAAALTGSPRERGEGGSTALSRGYPPACQGRWGYVASGAGPRAVGTERGPAPLATHCLFSPTPRFAKFVFKREVNATCSDMLHRDFCAGESVN